MASLIDFITTFNLTADFDSWANSNPEELTEEAFLDSLKGRSGKAAPFSLYEEFWISLFSEYSTSSDNKLIASFVFPETVYIEPNPIKSNTVNFEPASYDGIQLLMKSSKGFDIREIGGYNEDGGIISEPIMLSCSGNGKVYPLAGFSPTERIYLKSGTVLSFEWIEDELPEDGTFLSMTLQAYKRKYIPKDTAVIKGIIGLWYISVSGIGDLKAFNGVNDVDGNPMQVDIAYSAENLVNSLRGSESTYEFERTFVVSSDYLAPTNSEPSNLSFRNISDSNRIITMTPLIVNGSGNNGGIVDSQLLPENAYLEGGKLIIELAANQDI